MLKRAATYTNAWYSLAVARILLGFIFLWAFLDKTFGLGVATPASGAWLDGGSPTAGFLMGASKGDGPFASLFGSLANTPGVDALFMLGLLGIGVALIAGVALRIAAVAGTLMLVMMWMAVLPLENNPLIDDHIVYAVVLWVIAFGNRKWSLVDWWLSLDVVKKNKWLW